MTVEDVIVAAIRRGLSLEVIYDGYARLVSPIRYGWKETEKEGMHKNLFCYQFGGYSSRGLGPDGSMQNYRCWNLENISGASVVEIPTHSGLKWTSEPSTCIDRVIVGLPV